MPLDFTRRASCSTMIDPDEVFTFAEWCTLNKFSERTGRRILASGSGPIITQLSAKRIGIRRRDNALWQDSRART
jgi:hypothetical protein